MSFDSLAQQMYDAAIIENLNRFRHYLMGRATWEDARHEIEAFNNSFAEIDEEKLSSIIVGKMLFSSADKSNLAFEFCNVLNSYLSNTCAGEENIQEKYGKFKDAAQEIFSSRRDASQLPPDCKSMLMDFLKSSIFSLAARDGTYELDSYPNLQEF